METGSGPAAVTVALFGGECPGRAFLGPCAATVRKRVEWEGRPEKEGEPEDLPETIAVEISRDMESSAKTIGILG